ncbi:hypothetical protein [Moorella sp. E306M]|nr:hypothetical protein [Moorella sp. E306M]
MDVVDRTNGPSEVGSRALTNLSSAEMAVLGAEIRAKYRVR